MNVGSKNTVGSKFLKCFPASRTSSGVALVLEAAAATLFVE